MHIVYLAELNNPHTQRWVNYFARRGCRVSMLCDQSGPRPHPNVEIYHPHWALPAEILAFKLFPKPYGNNAFKWLAYKPIIRRLRPDIIHAMEALGYGHALARCGHAPKVLTPWGNDIFLDARRSRIARHLVTRGLKAADVITTNMPNLAEYLSEEFGVPSNRVRAFSWGVDLEMFNPHERDQARMDLRAEWGIPADAPVLISARRFDPYWGANEIIEAAAKILQGGEDCYFIILRAGGDEQFFNEMANRKISNDRVRFVSRYLTPEQMAGYLQAADGFLSCPHTDLLSISVVEGMACGAVPVVSDLPAYHTRLKDGETAWFAAPRDAASLANAMKRCLADRGRWEDIRRVNWETVQREDDWTKQAALMADIYESLTNQKILPP